MPRRVREFQIRSLSSGRVIDAAASPACAARKAARAARGGTAAEVIDVTAGWQAMTCRPRRVRGQVVAACEIKEPFRRRIKFNGRPLAGLRVRRRRRPR